MQITLWVSATIILTYNHTVRGRTSIKVRLLVTEFTPSLHPPSSSISQKPPEHIHSSFNPPLQINLTTWIRSLGNINSQPALLYNSQGARLGNIYFLDVIHVHQQGLPRIPKRRAFRLPLLYSLLSPNLNSLSCNLSAKASCIFSVSLSGRELCHILQEAQKEFKMRLCPQKTL